MQIQLLETRLLLAAVLRDGLLKIDGTTGRDLISLQISGKNILVNENGAMLPFSAAAVKQISISTGSGDDAVRESDSVTAPAKISGGDGDDSLRGGGGADQLQGDAGNDTLYGGTKGDLLLGGAGGGDVADYSARDSGIVVTLDGLANDGTGTEGDNVSKDIEIVRGGRGDDKLSGSS